MLRSPTRCSEVHASCPWERGRPRVRGPGPRPAQIVPLGTRASRPHADQRWTKAMDAWLHEGVPPACGPKRVRNRPMRARRPRTQDVRRQHPQAATSARSAGRRSCASPARPTFRSTRMTPLGTLVSRPQMGRQERRRASMRAGHERSRDAVSVGENILPPSPREGVGRRVRGRRTGGAITIPGRAAHAAARLAPGLAPVPVGPGRPRPPTRRPVRPRPFARARGPCPIPGGFG